MTTYKPHTPVDDYGEFFEILPTDPDPKKQHTLQIVHDAIEARRSYEEFQLTDMRDAEGNPIVKHHPISLTVYYTESIHFSRVMADMLDNIVRLGPAYNVQTDVILHRGH